MNPMIPAPDGAEECGCVGVILYSYRGSRKQGTVVQGLRCAAPLAKILRPIRGEGKDRRNCGAHLYNTPIDFNWS